MDFHGLGGDIRGKQTTSRPENVCPDVWKHVSDAAKKKAKQRWAIQKPKLENARQLRGIFFFEPDDEEFKPTMKAAPRKLEVPVPASMPWKKTDEEQWGKPPQYWETQDIIHLFCWCRRKHETKARRSWTQTSSRSHHCKWNEFCNSSQSCAQIHSDASSNENSRCKGSSGNGKNWRTYRHGSWRRSETKVRWSLKQGKNAEQCILRHWWISVISRIRSWNHNFKNTKGRVALRFIRSTHWTRIISFTNDGSKSNERYTRMRRTSRRRSIRWNPGQNGRCTIIVQKIDTLTKTQMAQIMVQYGRSSRSSWAKSVRSSFGRAVMGKSIRESYFKIRMGLFVNREQGLTEAILKDKAKQAKLLQTLTEIRLNPGCQLEG